MNGERLFTGTDYFTPFPKAEDVFANRVEEHAQYLLPLASVDLSRLSPDWQGRIHFVSPIEPAEGVVGADTAPHHTYLCRENWVGYRIIDGKYELAADFCFFHLAMQRAQKPADDVPNPTLLDLTVHYADARTGYDLRKAHFEKHGSLHHAWAKPGFFGGFKKADRVELVSDLGGVSLDSNWSNMENFPLAPQGDWVDDEGTSSRTVCPLTEDGRPFSYIGSVPIYHYIAETPDFITMLGGSVVLFYDPKTSIALTTFDWS